eukprot:CAMPEP_0194763922 /NCGR_PEP_ID=MMETSP0323_2-20130528/20736_1 /TAXON_ID=2866 ORGANISM="Crypthecodinium cohnii, Strain Seligo" /NCGR_SAMPLE_ID=MMETSP0323_2 /ASSEMBLY_ACC=CAM_ASM_000346 /LENGTH=129 /DNA_ID=CAMNT_0039689883 /DNA_START=187 /DNA_END=576 /DNA_ORIENTATION=-
MDRDGGVYMSCDKEVCEGYLFDENHPTREGVVLFCYIRRQDLHENDVRDRLDDSENLSPSDRHTHERLFVGNADAIHVQSHEVPGTVSEADEFKWESPFDKDGPFGDHPFDKGPFDAPGRPGHGGHDEL